MKAKLNIESIIDGSIEKGKLSESVQESLSNIERLENNIIDKQDTITDLDDIRDGANKGKTSVQSITINGESKTPDENGVVDLGKIYVTTLTYTATSKVENTLWTEDTFGDDINIIDHTFNNDTKVGIIYFSDRITTIGNNAFFSCDSLTSVTIPNSVTNIGSDAFSSCKSLTSVTIPYSVTTIGNQAFSGCENLKSITIPDSVTTIGENAFAVCNRLTSVTIGNGVTTIGQSVFRDCSSLTSVTIPDSVTTIGNYAFEDCSSLTRVTIGNGVTTIGNYAFEGCSNLTSVTIPDSVTMIGSNAFQYCSSLTSITIPDNVTTIGNHAFRDCSSLTSVYCKAVTPPAGDDHMFSDNASGRKIYVPMESVDAYKSATSWSHYADNIIGYRFNANFNDYYTKSETDDIIDGAIEKSKLAESVQESLSNIEKLENDKQDKLISGTNIKTINEESILGEGDFVIDGNNIWVANDLAQETQYLNTTIKQYGELIESKYVKSETGIPVADLSEEVQTSLSKADTAIQLSDLEYFKLPGTLEQYKNIDSNITLTESDWQLISLGVNNRKHIVIESSTGRVYSVTYSIPIVPQELYTGHMTFIAENIRFNIRIFAKTSTTAIMSVTKEVLVTENSLNESLQNLIYVADFDTYMLYEVLYYPSKYYDIDIRPLCDTITQKRTIIVNQETSVSNGGYITNGVINSQDNELVLTVQLSTGCYKITLSTENDIAQLNSDTVTFISYTNDKTIENVDTSYKSTDFDLESGELLKLQNENGIETLKLAVASDIDVKSGKFTDGYSPLIMAHTAWTLYTDLQTQIDNIYYNVSSIARAGTYELQPNTFYKFGSVSTPLSSIAINLGTKISGVVNEYIFEIYTNATTVPTLSLPTDIKWVSGNAPVLEENKTYQISIVNNLGTVLSWDNV